jgi:hypothetical protein
MSQKRKVSQNKTALTEEIFPKISYSKLATQLEHALNQN